MANQKISEFTTRLALEAFLHPNVLKFCFFSGVWSKFSSREYVPGLGSWECIKLAAYQEILFLGNYSLWKRVYVGKYYLCGSYHFDPPCFDWIPRNVILNAMNIYTVKINPSPIMMRECPILWTAHLECSDRSSIIEHNISNIVLARPLAAGAVWRSAVVNWQFTASSDRSLHWRQLALLLLLSTFSKLQSLELGTALDIMRTDVHNIYFQSYLWGEIFSNFPQPFPARTPGVHSRVRYQKPNQIAPMKL